MEFKTEAHKACYEKVAALLKELFGEYARAREDTPTFTLWYGSAFTGVTVDAWGDDDAVVNTRAWVVTKADLTPELMRYLLEENDTMRFGAFGVDKDGDIFFEHAIVGSSVDKAELQASIMAVMRMADDYDDKIIARWGGQRAADR